MRGLLALSAASFMMRNGGQQNNTTRQHMMQAFVPFVPLQPQQQQQQQNNVAMAVHADAAVSSTSSSYPPFPGFVQTPEYENIVSNDDAVKEVQEDMSKLPIKRQRTRSVLSEDEKKLSEEERQLIKDDQFREEFFVKRLLLDETKPEHKLIRQGLSSVSSRTFRSYASHFDAMFKSGCNILDPRQVNIYLGQHRDTCQGSINSWVGAVELFHGAYGIHDPAANRQRRLAARGRKTMIPVRTHKPRGVIDKTKLEQLRKHALFKGTHYADGTVLQWAFGLRSGQVSSITANEIHFENKVGVYQYVSFRRKMRGGRGAHPSETEIHDCDPTCVKQVRDILAAAKEDPTRQTYLIPGWISRVANQKVKKAAKDLDWGELLNWVNHGNRHGSSLAAADASADQTLEGRVLAAQRRTAQKSHGVIEKTYLQSVEDRELISKALARRGNTRKQQIKFNGKKCVVFTRRNVPKVKVQTLKVKAGKKKDEKPAGKKVAGKKAADAAKTRKSKKR